MKITKMRTEVYRWKRNKPIRNGMYTYAEAGLNVVKLETDEGIEGIGLGGGMTDDGAVFQAIGAQFAPVVVGQDPLANEKIWSDLWQPKLIGRRGLTTRVISAIDNALWDIKGKAAGMPVYKLLGGFSDAVPVYIAGGYYEEGKGLGDLAREMEESVSMGARAVKMKIGGASINEDVERVRVVRDAVGPSREPWYRSTSVTVLAAFRSLAPLLTYHFAPANLPNEVEPAPLDAPDDERRSDEDDDAEPFE